MNLSHALSYPAMAGPRLRGRLASILARTKVVLLPTRHKCAKPSCNTQIKCSSQH